MTSHIKGRWIVSSGRKLKKIDTANVSQKLARKAKADRTEKRLRANRDAILYGPQWALSTDAEATQNEAVFNYRQALRQLRANRERSK